MSELDDMRAFVEVLASGGFSRAGQRLGLAKSIVSRRVSALEASLGVRLLSRTTRGVTATEAGEAFRQRAERIIADIADAREAVADSNGEVVGLLRVAAPLSFGLREVAPALAELAATHPRLQIEAAYDDRRVDIIADRYDAAIRIGELSDSTLVARSLAPVAAAIVASPDYIARHGTPRVPEDLARHDMLLRTGPLATAPLRFRDGKRWINVTVSGRFRADNGEALLAAAIAGVGLGVLPTFLCGQAIAEGKLIPLLQDFELPAGAIHLVRPPGQHVPAKVRALTELLVTRFGGQPAWDACLMHKLKAGTDG